MNESYSKPRLSRVSGKLSGETGVVEQQGLISWSTSAPQCQASRADGPGCMLAVAAPRPALNGHSPPAPTSPADTWAGLSRATSWWVFALGSHFAGTLCRKGTSHSQAKGSRERSRMSSDFFVPLPPLATARNSPKPVTARPILKFLA